MATFINILLVLLSSVRLFALASISSDAQAFIVKSQHHGISLVHLAHDKAASNVPLLNATHALHIEYDIKHNCIFYATTDQISRQCIDGRNRAPEVLVSYGISHIEDLAYDWMSGVLFFSDSGRRKIDLVNVSNTDYVTGKRLRRTIVANGLTPTQIVVHPKHSYLFFTGWDRVDKRLVNATIYRVNRDGLDLHQLAYDRVRYPVGLALDYDTDRLYWNDRHLNYIASCDLWGLGFKILLVHGANDITSGLSVYKNLIYYLKNSADHSGAVDILAVNKGVF